MKTLMATIAVLLVWETAIAAEAPSIAKGYGKTKWGQSRQEVAGLLGVGELGKPDGDLVVPGAGSVEQTAYHFYSDKLVQVSVYIALPVDTDRQAAVGRIREILVQKYPDNVMVRSVPPDNGIYIRVKDLPKDRANREGAIMVEYMNQKLLDSLVSRDKDQREAEARKAVDAMGLGDVL